MNYLAKHWKIALAFLFIGNGTLAMAQSAHRGWLLKLPIIALGRESNGALEFNLSGKGSLSLEGNWTYSGEDYSKKEQEKYPGASLEYSGREYGLMYHRYVNSTSMSGFHWGIGAGYRENTANWLKVPEMAEASSNVSHYNVLAAGPTATLRGGYRWVSEDLGLMLGLHLNFRHFEATIKDRPSEADPTIVAISENDSGKLKDRLSNVIFPGLELGWAF